MSTRKDPQRNEQRAKSPRRRHVDARLKEYGKPISCFAENIAYFCEDAKEALLQLIVDDSDKTPARRFHREIVFSPDFRVIGCYTGDHARFRSMSCINYCGEFVRHEEEDPLLAQV